VGRLLLNTTPCEPGMTPSGFHLYFFRGDDCLPVGLPEVEIYVPGSVGETFVECAGGYPLYEYEVEVNVPIPGNVRYWFAAEMGDHQIPPQWGRLGSDTESGCMSAWGSFAGSEWAWVPAEDMGQYTYDVSQEFECESAVPVRETTWGRVKTLYR